MIKIIVTFVTCFLAVLMLVLAFSTTHWTQHVVVNAGFGNDQVHQHHEGLLERCYDVYENDTFIESKSDCINIPVEAWNVILMILLALAILFFIIAFVFAAIYSFYTRRSKYPLLPNCTLIALAALGIFIAMMIYTFKFWKDDILFSWSYGAGWTAVGMSLIGIVLIAADR